MSSKIVKSYFKNLFYALLYWVKAVYYLIQTKYFWRSLPKILFVVFFWEGLGATVIFLLMIPAMLSGHLPVWLGICGSIFMGFAGGIISKTYDSVNPIRGIYHKLKKKNEEK